MVSSIRRVSLFAIAITSLTSAFAQTPSQPTLEIYKEGPVLHFQWNASDNAAGYRFYYAPFPDQSPVNQIDMGNALSLSGVVESDGAAFYAAVEPYNDSGIGPYSNVIDFEIDIDNIFYPPEEQLTVCSYVHSVGVAAEISCELKDFATYEAGPLSNYVVTDSKVIYNDIAQRRSELSVLDTETLSSYCREDAHLAPGSWSLYTAEPVPPLTDEIRGVTGDMMATMTYGRILHDYLSYEEEAGGMVQRSLRAWADAGTLLEFDFSINGDASVALDYRILFDAMVLAWNSVKNDSYVPDEDRAAINSYLTAVATKMNFVLGNSLGSTTHNFSDATNPGWSQAIGLMAYGIAFNNNYYFQRAIRHYFAILDGMIREDGSIWYASQRGGRALGYSVYGTGLLLRLAEMATLQGYNLYDVEIDGVDLHDIVNFHISALEDNELIHQYSMSRTPGFTDASEPGVCAGEECNNWNNQLYGFSYDIVDGIAAYADFEIYTGRYPNSELANRFYTLFPQDQYEVLQEGALAQTCEFRPL